MTLKTPLPELYAIDPGPNFPEKVRMIVEIPKHSGDKYEYSPQLGVFRVDRTLYSPMHYPGDYGFIPGTIAEDGDPLDVLTLIDNPTFPGCLIVVRPVGVLDLIEESGVDHKVIAVPDRNPRFEQIATVDDAPTHLKREIEHFFTIYKELEQKSVQTQGWRGVKAALEIVKVGRERYHLHERD